VSGEFAASFFRVEDVQGMFHLPDCSVPPNTLFQVGNNMACILETLGANSVGHSLA
jgi:hypothetical protein